MDPSNEGPVSVQLYCSTLNFLQKGMIKIREYRVPFSTKNDEKLVFNLSARECLWLGGGVITAIVLVGIPALIMQLPLPKILYLLPLGLLSLGASVYMAFAKVKNFDKHVKVDTNFWYKLKYSKRPHCYYQFRK